MKSIAAFVVLLSLAGAPVLAANPTPPPPPSPPSDSVTIQFSTPTVINGVLQPAGATVTFQGATVTKQGAKK